MSKKMRTILSIILTLTMLLTFLPSVTAAAAQKVGDPLGDVLYSDITAYINGQPIPTSIKNGTTMVVVEDLANYGFDVKWDGKAKTLKVEPNANKTIKPLPVEANTKPVGSFKCKYVYTDIKTYLSGVLVESFAIDGRTLIDFELLAKYGKLSWNGQKREIRLDTELNVKDFDLKEIRVVIDGKVNKVTGFRFGDDYWFTASTIQSLLKTVATGMMMNLSGTPYYRMNETAEKLGLSSCENDTVLDSVYIWTDLDTRFSELDRAENLGFGKPSDDAITFSEFMTMLDKMVEIADKSKLAEWKTKLPEARKSDTEMNRSDGMLAVFYAVETLGGEYLSYNTDWRIIFNKRKDTWSKPNLDIFPQDYKNKVAIYDYIVDDYQTFDHQTDSFFYSIGRMSLYSGNTIFDFDAVTKTMRFKDPFTINEAMLTCVRLIDSVSVESVSGYVPLSEAGTYDKNIITDKLLRKANALPKLTKDNMPVWKGFVLHNGGDGSTITVTDDDLRNVAEWGFNTIRFGLLFQKIFDKEVKTVNETYLKELDNLIASAIKYNLHIDIVTGSLPGFWSDFDFDTNKMSGECDLFINPERQKEASKILALLAERYKDIPGSVLSFCPILEATTYVFGGVIPYDPYTVEDVAKVYIQLIAAIREHDPDRFIIYEPTPMNDVDTIISQSEYARNLIESTYDNVLMITNFCETAFVYSEMTIVKGDNLDLNNHAMFKPEYPVTVYGTQHTINNGKPLEMDGALVTGTKIDIYLAKVDGNGDFNIKADGKSIYNEKLSTKNYKVDNPLSGQYPYAKSDKLISVTLLSDIKNLEIGYSGNWFEWSGIDVTLPDKYAVKRWWFPSPYDAFLETGKFDWNAPPILKDTSNILISPYFWQDESARKITINSDITYTTASIYAQSNKQTISAWVKDISQYAPRSMVRFEAARHSIGCSLNSAIKYYSDMLEEFNKYNFSWFSNDYQDITNGTLKYAGSTPVPYKDKYNLNVELLKTLQKYQ